MLCDKIATNQLKRQRINDHESTLEFPLTPRNLPVEISYRRHVLSSHYYVSILREEIGLDRHRTFLQIKYKWTNQSWAALPGTPSIFVQDGRTTSSPPLGPNLFTIGSSKTEFQRCPLADQYVPNVPIPGRFMSLAYMPSATCPED